MVLYRNWEYRRSRFILHPTRPSLVDLGVFPKQQKHARLGCSFSTITERNKDNLSQSTFSWEISSPTSTYAVWDRVSSRFEVTDGISDFPSMIIYSVGGPVTINVVDSVVNKNGEDGEVAIIPGCSLLVIYIYEVIYICMGIHGLAFAFHSACLPSATL